MVACGEWSPYTKAVREVLMVSKPVEPPWNDSSKNLVRDLSSSLLNQGAYRPVVMIRAGSTPLYHGTSRAVYRSGSKNAPGGAFALAIREQASVARALLMERRTDLWHFFFAPNPRSSVVALSLARTRRMPTVHTVCSVPRPARTARALRRLVFADLTVVLSQRTFDHLAESGVSESRLIRIPPAVTLLPSPEEATRRSAAAAFRLDSSAPVVVFPGDLEFGDAATRMIEALPHITTPGVQLVMACRKKTPRASDVERRLRARTQELSVAQRVSWVGETAAIHSLLGAADVVALPATTTYAKMDYPLVLLEAMSLERAVVVGAHTAAEELAALGGAVRTETSAQAIADTISRLLDDDDRRARQGQRARAIAAEEFSLTTMAERYVAAYNALY